MGHLHRTDLCKAADHSVVIFELKEIGVKQRWRIEEIEGTFRSKVWENMSNTFRNRVRQDMDEPFRTRVRQKMEDVPS